MRDLLGEYMASQQRMMDRTRERIIDAAQAVQDAEEQLVRDHFADTPLALSSVLRTGIMPWNIVLQVMREQPDFDDPTTIRISERARVVEYPRV